LSSWLPWLHYDLARFGSEREFSRQADMLMVMGTISKKYPILRQVYEQMSEPRWVIAVGACASSGGIFDTYLYSQGIDKVIPVDVYVPGCLQDRSKSDGVMKLQELVRTESVKKKFPEYQELLASYNIK
jgi:NADH-quinone oxidoreductase subunit B